MRGLCPYLRERDKHPAFGGRGTADQEVAGTERGGWPWQCWPILNPHLCPRTGGSEMRLQNHGCGSSGHSQPTLPLSPEGLVKWPNRTSGALRTVSVLPRQHPCPRGGAPARGTRLGPGLLCTVGHGGARAQALAVVETGGDGRAGPGGPASIRASQHCCLRKDRPMMRLGSEPPLPPSQLRLCAPSSPPRRTHCPAGASGGASQQPCCLLPCARHPGDNELMRLSGFRGEG